MISTIQTIKLKFQCSNWFIQGSFTINNQKQLNLHFNKFDKWVQKMSFEIITNQRSQKYKQLSYQINQIIEEIRKLDRRAQGFKTLLKALETLKKEKNKISNLTMNHVPIEYVRYYGDWIIGITGNKSLVKQIKAKINHFLKIELDSKIYLKRINIINLKVNKANFLGYQLFFSKNQKISFTTNINNRVYYQTKPKLQFSIPINLIFKVIEKKGYSKKLNKEYKSIYKSSYITLKEVVIIKHFVKFWILISNYYSICTNFRKLRYIYSILYLSYLMTLSNRYRAKKIFFKI